MLFECVPFDNVDNDDDDAAVWGVSILCGEKTGEEPFDLGCCSALLTRSGATRGDVLSELVCDADVEGRLLGPYSPTMVAALNESIASETAL